jgi:NAD(P)-dependent dehydrogenase (short-subunit alcohol dehydrogenase family)
MDLSSLEAVKTAMQAHFTHDRLDILICNAGIMGAPASLSADGFEIHMATNHLGHAMLIRELLPVMLQTAATSTQPGDVRIVILSSSGFKRHPKDGIAWGKVKDAQKGTLESTYRYG